VHFYATFEAMKSQVAVLCVPEVYAAFWGWRQHCPPKRWYPTTLLHGVISQKTANVMHFY